MTRGEFMQFVISAKPGELLKLWDRHGRVVYLKALTVAEYEALEQTTDVLEERT